MNTSYPLSGIERQNQIVDRLLRNERVNVTDICKTFSVSEAIARRDLDTLAEQGWLQRVHGGAIPVPRAIPEAPILDRHQEPARTQGVDRSHQLPAGHQLAYRPAEYLHGSIRRNVTR